MTEGNRGMMHKKQLGLRLRIEASLEMQLHNNRPPRLSHHCWPSQSVKRPEGGGIAGDFVSSSALSILQDFWSLVLVFMELVKVNVAAVA